MRAKVHHHLLITTAQNPRVRKGRDAGANLDRNTTSVVNNTILESPTVGVPHPIRKRTVYQRGPEKGKDHAGNDAASLGDSSDGESSSDGAEHHLVEGVQEGGDKRRADRGSGPDVSEAKVLEVANEGVVGGLAKGEGVSPEIPLEDNDTKGHHDDPEHGEGRLSSCEAGVEECDAGDHKEDETGAEEDEGLVAGLIPLVEIFGSCFEGGVMVSFEVFFF